MGQGVNGVFKNVEIEIKRKTSAAWAFTNPILSDGEPGYELDLRGLKIGNGVTPWVGLPYFSVSTGTVTSVAATITGSAVSITGSPVTTSGTLALTWTGAITDFVLGDGSIASISSILGASGFVPYTGATATVNLNTQTLLAGPIGGTYVQALDNIGASVTIKAQNQNANFFSQFNLVNDNSTVVGSFNINNTTRPTDGIKIPGGVYIETDGPRLCISNYGTGTIDFATGVYSVGSSPTIKASISSAGVFQINTLKISTSSTLGYVWTATDTIGNGSWQVAATGSSLPSNQIGYGNGSAIVSSGNFTRNATSGWLNLGNAQASLGTYRTDVEPMITVARSTDPTVNTNAHAFVDATLFKRNNNSLAYNSYTANVTYFGSALYDHYAAFQSAFAVTDTATLSNYYGFTDNISLDTGTSISVRYGFIINDAIGAGTIGDQYGVFIPTMSKGTSKNYAINVVSNDSNFGGNIRFTTSGSAAGALTPQLAFYHATTYKTSYIVNYLEANSSRLQMYVSGNSLIASIAPLQVSGDDGSGLGIGPGTVIMSGRAYIGANTYPTASLDIASISNLAHLRMISNASVTVPNSGEFGYNGTNILFRNGATLKSILDGRLVTGTFVTPDTANAIEVVVAGTTYKLQIVT